MADILEFLKTLIPPDTRQQFSRGDEVLEMLNPVNAMTDAMYAGQDMVRADDLPQFIDATGRMVTNTASVAAPAVAAKFAGLPYGDVVRAVAGRTAAADDVLADFARKESGAAKISRSTELPQLRGMDVDDATRVARRQSHLIPSGDASEGMFVGGPRNIKTRRDLTTQRRAADRNVARGAEGGDWYDRYRQSVVDVTGGRTEDMDWMTPMHGQYSAGVSPEGELGFTLRDLNSGLATGENVKAARPAQVNATRRALETGDPTNFQLGPKTGEYARRIHPDTAGERTATGVNDFRHARTLGFTEADGTPQRNAIGEAGHRWSDYETALMVDRANKNNLAGRSDWTGEQIQAAPWVAQKADDFYGRQTAGYTKKAKARLARAGNKNPSATELEQVGRDISFEEANRTIGDFFPKHTAYGTYEAQPFVDAGHLPGLAGADDATRAAYAADPRSRWTDGYGRDEIYSGYREPGTGQAMRVRPSVETQGVYTPQGGVKETNPGAAARPLVGIETVKGRGHVMPAEDRALMDGAEATRALIDVQGAGAWHKPQFGGVKVGDADMIRLNRPNAGTSSLAELEMLEAIGGKHGLPNAIDTGDGITMANFGDEIPMLGAKPMREMTQEITDQFGDDFSTATRGRLDSGYIDFEDAWRAPQGQGTVTQEFMNVMDGLPEATVQKLDANPTIPMAATDRMLRDADYAATMGATRQDVQNMRDIIGQGPGWIGRLKAGLASGAVLPALGMAVLSDSAKGDRPADTPQGLPMLSGSGSI